MRTTARRMGATLRFARKLLGRLRLNARIAVAVAFLVVLAAGAIVVRLDASERQALNRELELNQIQALVNQVSYEQWQALATGDTDADRMARFQATWSTAKQTLRRLHAESPGDARLSGVVIAFDAYAADIDQELILLDSSSQYAAELFEQNTVGATKDLLSNRLADASAAYRAQAARAASIKATNSIITAVVAASIVVGLLWLMRQSQRRAERRFRALVQYSSDVFSILDPRGRIVYESEAVERTLGYPASQRLGTSAWDHLHPDDQAGGAALLMHVVSAPGVEATTELRALHADGQWRRIVGTAKNLMDDPAVGGIVLSYRDVTEQRAMEEQLRRQALEDPLTGLSNRALLRDRMEHALARAQRASNGGRVVVFFLDLDDFKTVNDSLGHAAGDVLLTAVGQRLTGAVRAIDTIARLGGDEFAVLAEDVSPEMDPTDLGRRLMHALVPAFQVAGNEIFVRASIGYAVASAGDDCDVLLRNADLAMYQAKADGKSGMRLYEPGLHTSAVARLELENDMRRAIDAREFTVEYQPIVDLDTDEIKGVEALLRWNHPTRGWLAPDQFIPLAEESGMIIEIGRWVLDEATRQVAEWRRKGIAGPDLKLSVNLSVKQIRDPAIADDVAAALARSGLPGPQLTLEITENILVEDSEAVIGRLAAIRDLGVRIAIDDFGTGFSSLGYLSRFPVDVLKIDRSFVQAMSAKASDLAVIEAAIGLASTLGLETVAEGIERSGQTRKLRELGCRLGQGFLYARPASPAQLARELRARSQAGKAKAARAPRLSEEPFSA
jgi:diguanylate cyclase (GGDEF)-like protein/PAS domain S-box-containing protein